MTRLRTGIARVAGAALVLGAVASCGVIAGLKDRSLEGPAGADSTVGDERSPGTDADADAADATGDSVDAAMQMDAAPDVDADANPRPESDSGSIPDTIATDAQADARDAQPDVVDASGPPPPPKDSGADATLDGGNGCPADAGPLSWTVYQSVLPPEWKLTAVSGSGPDDVWAVGQTPELEGVAAHWDGQSWTQVDPGAQTPGGLNGVWATGPGTGWMVGSSFGDVYELQGSGELSFTSVTFGSSVMVQYPVGVWVDLTGASVYAATAEGLITIGPGPEWSQVPGNSPGATALAAVGGTSSNDVWAVGSGAAFHFNGSTWSPVEGTDVADYTLSGVWAVATGTAVVAGTSTQGGLVAYIDAAPMTFTSVYTSGTGVTLNAVWADASGDAWAVGDDGGTGFIVAVTQTPGTWAQEYPPTAGESNASTLNGIWGSCPSDIWAVGDGATILHYGPTADR